MKNIQEMTRKEFESLPSRNWNEDIGWFNSMIILPSEVKKWSILKYKIKLFIAKIFNLDAPEIYTISGVHDSGFRCMDFVAVRDGEAICRLSGCSDVIHFDGIGGYGYNWLNRYGKIPKMTPPSDWNMDCLLESGLFRIFTRGKIRAGEALSSMEIFYEARKDD